MTRQSIAALVLLLAVGAGEATAEAAPGPGDAMLEVELEALPETPYEQEMVLLTVRGFYRVGIARSELEQPAAAGFGWMNLGRDTWADTSSEGRQGRSYARVLAIFPQQAGRVRIGAFVQHLTLLGRDGVRYQQRLETEPVELEVRPRPEGQGWWLPARALRVTDSWDRAPDRLEPGQTATRSVILEAEGVGPEQLPPPPELKARGLIVFVDPEERSSEQTHEGPVSRVTWRWTVRPSGDAPALLPAVTIPWFNTIDRRFEEAVLAPQRVAIAGASGPEPDVGTVVPISERFAAWALPIGGLAGLACGLLLLLPGLRLRSRDEIARLVRRLLPDPELGAMRRAARRGDALSARRAARRLLRRRPVEAAAALIEPLDRNLFGPESGHGRVDLRHFARGFHAAWRRGATGRLGSGSPV